MPQILCKHCGMPNAPERMVCSFCHQPLHVVEDESESIRPGDVPTKKSTGELEPILPEWLRDARENARRAENEKTAEEAQSMAMEPEQADKPPDLLAGLESVSRDDQDYDVPNWLSSATSAKPASDEGSFPRRQELNWGNEAEDELGGMATTPVPTAPESGDAMLPWMQDLAKEPTEDREEAPGGMERQPSTPQELPSVSPFAAGTFKPPDTGELTDWLDKASSEMQGPATPAGSSPDDSLGQWLSTLPPVDAPSGTPKSSETLHEDIDLPDWMKSVGEASAPVQATAGEAPLPDWMASFREKVESAEQKAGTEQPAPELPSAPAFSEETLDNEQTRELFSAEMPDWLSNIAPAEQKPEPAARRSETPPQESISPADLPSWVQAMRPVETVLPDADAALPLVEGPVEKEGPLAGLQGVLPLVGGLIQPGKSRAQAISLQVSDAQHADASLLEKMLASETEAKPLRGGGMLVSQRVLRWVLSALLIGLISFFLVTGLQTASLPVSLPAETEPILAVLDALPENAPVLMIFDYEPALSGELEAAAAPFVDHLLALRHPRLILLSTSPTGAALAERFFKNTQAQHAYQRQQDYIDLGYLPGGTIGILSFAENPRSALPLSDWNLPPAQDVNRLSDYAAIVLLTDQAETARAWVEQTTTRRGEVPLLVVSSAQAAPMIQPYLFSGQVDGLVNGVQGGAAFESSNGSVAFVRHTWDAFNYATLLAALLMVLGGLWNLIAGARARRRALDEV